MTDTAIKRIITPKHIEALEYALSLSQEWPTDWPGRSELDELAQEAIDILKETT